MNANSQSSVSGQKSIQERIMVQSEDPCEGSHRLQWTFKLSPKAFLNLLNMEAAVLKITWTGSLSMDFVRNLFPNYLGLE